MADVNTVYNVIQHIDELRHYGRDRQLEKQFPDGRSTQHFFVIVHWLPPSVLLVENFSHVFCQTLIHALVHCPILF